MNGVFGALRALFGLFVDNGALALAEIGVLVSVELLLRLGGEAPLAMAVLVAGTLGVLLANVLGAAFRAKALEGPAE